MSSCGGRGGEGEEGGRGRVGRMGKQDQNGVLYPWPCIVIVCNSMQ